jgi:hypothetical protein
MKVFAALVVFLLSAGDSVSYFKYSREVRVPAVGTQAYVVADESLWQHAGPGLASLRLFGDAEIPYALLVEEGGSQTQQQAVRILQPGVVAGKTQFVLDMTGVAEYDHVELTLKATNFVCKATVEGQDDLHGTRWAVLGHTIFYDLSSDHLGADSTLRLPLTTYKYLRITLDGPVNPTQIESATAAERQEQKAIWRNLGVAATRQIEGKDSVFLFHELENVPIERLAFKIDPTQVNFRRQVEIQNEKKQPLGYGELNRIHLVRQGQKVDSERSEVDFQRLGSKETLRVVVHNGDDPPLKIADVSLEQYERRIYFTSSAPTPRLYYGDDKLASPVYDYAKLFQQDPKAGPATLGPETANAAYTGRPDERPWSERHPAVLWVAIVGAVLLLGAMALRSMRSVAER